MNNEVQVFNNEEFGQVRTIVEQGNVLFCASDVAKALGYAIPSKAVNTHCKGVSKMEVPTSGGRQNMLFIPEGDVYRLIIRSKLPAAERFERWVFDEVLPTIHKHGAYMTDEAIYKAITEPDFLISLATELKKEKEARRKAELKIEQDKPKVLFANAVGITKSDCTIGNLSKILKQNGIEIGQKRLFQWLRDNDYLMKTGMDKNRPTQIAMEKGLFRVNERHRVGSNGTLTFFTTYVTGEGQLYFVNLFLRKKELQHELCS
ncbi:hypothetical protein CJ260_00595 [Megasphaera sp. ASD88]|uniref:phage antirepressor n=1 Tax=Megasphaera sp. ASD88 TaxID=2027407 RepID=UPI000BAB49C8|nr:phage antirepressor [Megasphaera sp. ASD88]PAV39970.1 hypothetical protein CJ260_00595 [Megasphaera sp. ASD88]